MTIFFQKTSSAIPARLCLLFALILLHVSCVRENTEDCVQYAIKVKVVDVEGNNLVTSEVLQKTDVYLFGKRGFIRMIPVGISTDYLFGHGKSEKLTLVAWGNAKADTLITPEIAVGTSLKEAKLTVKQYADRTHLPMTDLFYDHKELDGTTHKVDDASAVQTRSMREESITLTMERVAAGVSIHTHNLAECYPYGKNELEGGGRRCLMLRGSGSEINFAGEVREEAQYSPSVITDKAGNLHTQSFRIIPGNGHIEIDIYAANGRKLCTVTEDNNFKPLYAPPGRQTNIDIDFRNIHPSVKITVLPWGDVRQDIEM
ncbi:FimB/Mfa2 family fimbrial subunit [Bacteroides helcogenes]|uniref:Lipoprotein n=1 Tax=Bacteroides helcogenes (strain ATCC 35417 / DSM 20613 / JCM 6297 / CCUG 15421 / P 36-108) TaxID=693979 RepID=E6SWZ4_BACT6|nr:FimB/Mfa2 family fimbrial subunit [Bacteroides helcogenes]ADV44682.1 hypothetical protein Bache_2738 [Bacteroides helcogenes P 36-108]MDY5238554.1 FimB/Mfa2 family fimbrial subunit [Bacteroides helcogenes]